MIIKKQFFNKDIYDYKIINYYNKMDSVGTYWIPLKTNMIPFLDREVD